MSDNKLIKIRVRDFTEYKPIDIKTNKMRVDFCNCSKRLINKLSTWDFYMSLLKAANGKTAYEKGIIYSSSEKYKEEKFPELFKILPDGVFVNGYVGRVYVSDIEIPGIKGGIDTEITIESRLDCEETDRKYFLISLLSRGRLNRAFGDSRVGAEDDDVFKFLIMFMYINALEEAVRGGFYKEYVKHKRNDLNVRGRIDVSRHIKENSLYRDRIAYEYGEQTYDNPVNRLILAAADVLKKYNINDFLPVNLKNTLAVLRQQIFGYSFLSAAEIGKAASKPITKSFYIKYEELRRVCLKILKNEGVNIFGEDTGRTRGLLMYVPELWENLVLHYFDKYLKGFKTEAQYSYEIMLENEKVWGIEPNTSRPDMVIKKEGKISAIIDAKYKPGWLTRGEEDKYAPGRRRADINQVKAYMYDLNCKKGGIIYPSKSESTFFHKYKSSGLNPEDFCVIAVNIPKVKKNENNEYESYSEWLGDLNNSFNVIISELKKFIQNSR